MLFMGMKFLGNFSLQIPHMRQWWIILQTTELLCLLKLSDQLARSSTSTTPCSMTQCTLNSEHTIFNCSRDIGQCRSKWSIASPFHLRIQHQSTTTTCCLLKLSTVKFSPNDAVQMKKLTLVGTFGVHNCFHGKDSGLVGCNAYNNLATLFHFKRAGIYQVHKRGNWL